MVKLFHSQMSNSPQLTGTAGALLAVLDACLVNGFGLKTVDSLVVASDVATANISTGHSAEVGSVVLISGATPSGLNGEHRVTATTPTSVSFETAGISDQTATGTIALRIASAGWAREFNSGNISVYKPTDVAALGMRLQVDDQSTTDARVVGYETMTSATVGTGPFPTAAQQSGGYYWPKSRTGSEAISRGWVLVADERAFYLCVVHDASLNPTSYTTVFFGDFNPTASADSYASALAGGSVSFASVPASNALGFDHSARNAATSMAAPRSWTGAGTSVILRRHAPDLGSTGVAIYSGSNNTSTPYPNGPDGKLYLSAFNLTQHVDSSYRGAAPGAYFIPQVVAGQFAARDVLPNIVGLEGRRVVAIPTFYGAMAIDATGPWR